MTNRQIVIGINGGDGWMRVALGQVERVEERGGKKEAAKLVLGLKDGREIWVMNKLGDQISRFK
jgi:hypothetical protein